VKALAWHGNHDVRVNVRMGQANVKIFQKKEEGAFKILLKP
jgi:hypothetical protein